MNNQKEYTKTPDFFLGVVEDRMDPLKLGRARVRVLGLHHHDKSILPTEDLPWAYKIQPTTSGAISGIGYSPVGVIEGTWVIVQFVDPDKQMPFIVGTISGIHQSKKTQLEEFEINFSGEAPGEAPGESSGETNTNDNKTEAEQLQEAQNSNTFRSAKEFKMSESGISLLKQSEGFRSKPYRDSTGKWTIGYGNTYLADNSPVTENTPEITAAQGDVLLRSKLQREFEPAVKYCVRVPISQSMFDSLVHLSYNIGPGGIKTFVNGSGLNRGDYAGTAAKMIQHKTVNGLLKTRRKKEADLFLREGYPDNTGNIIETPQSINYQETSEKTESNLVATGSGWKRRKFDDTNRGFKDPSNKYPLLDLIDEPDTNRLARNEKIRNTIVYTKELAEHIGVPTANNKNRTWNQSPTPYNAEYPFNNVWQSESGHFLEFDDTKDRERVHIYHKSGTFTEIDHNGTQVNRIVGDGYQILERNGRVHVLGDLDVCVEGAKTLRIEKTMDIEVHGNTNINIHDSAKFNVAGDLDLTTGGHFFVKCGGNCAIDAPRIDLNSDVASGLQFISDIADNDVTFSELSVRTRKEEDAMNYENDDDHTKQGKIQRILSGTAISDDFTIEPNTTPPEKIDSAEQGKAKRVSCTGMPPNGQFIYNEKISKYYTLNDLTDNGRRKIVNQNGLMQEEIYCNLKTLAINVLDPLKEKYPDMKISSGLRLGASISQHNKGQAVDIQFDTNREQLYNRVKEIYKIIPSDQMILEYASGSKGWIHISYNKEKNRKEIFTMNNHKRVSPMGSITLVS